jgi:hypothetical protein
MPLRRLITVALVALAACSSAPAAAPTPADPSTTAAPITAAPATTTTAPTTTTTTAPPAPTLPPPTPGTCPAAPPLAEPDPDRPVYDVHATIDVPAGTVEGVSTIRFRPDLPIDRVVLRLWANSPRIAAVGGAQTVGPITDAATGTPMATNQPDATTVEVLLPGPIGDGEEITLAVPFHLQVGSTVNDRVSHSGDTLRLGSFLPLLAWEPGVGWDTEPPTSGFAEAASSTVADWTVTLDVTPGYDVLASGRRDGNTWRATAARDVAASIGHFRVVTAVEDLPNPVQVDVGVDASLAVDEAAFLGRVVEALRDFTARFGPYPYETFTLALTPDLDGGIEFPGHVMQGPGTLGRTTPHEVGHQWFYGLVGNDQGRDPFLDEALASYAEFRFEGTIDVNRARAIPSVGRGLAGAPMTYWETRQSAYYRSVYVQGAVAVASLGDLDLVDCALRLYVATNAFRIARPADLVAALSVVFPDAATRLAAYGINP